MEESVTKKFVHEDSGSVTLFCGEYYAQLFFANLLQEQQTQIAFMTYNTNCHINFKKITLDFFVAFIINIIFVVVIIIIIIGTVIFSAAVIVALFDF